ncbi:MAG: ATP synthase F1 subunit delta [Clostridia bacterium]|nr:ATP synthase F1 subunit delta [Clostridia bacterium]
MNNRGNEYAEALFLLACETKSEDEILNALDLSEEVFNENPEYIDFLLTPSIPVSERLEAIDEAFSKAVPEYVLSFIKLLCEKGNIDSIFQCIKEYKALYDNSKKVITAKVISATELNDEEKSALYEKLKRMSKKEVTMEYSIDKDIIGGMIIEMDGKVIDGSVRSRLKEVKDVISR